MSPTLMFIEQPRRTVRDSGGSGSGGSMGCFLIILVAGVVLYFILKGRGDKREVLGASHRPMGSGPLQPVTFACPYPKCPTCGGSSDKMKQSWDGMRKVTWTCGYCSAVAGVQELKDEELPASARQRLGLDVPQGPAQGMQGHGQDFGNPGSGIGGLLTGMMIGNMMSGGSHHHHQGGSRSDGDGTWSDGSSSTNSDWGSGNSSSSDWGGSSDSGGDWGGGDSGGGDSGGSDW